MGSHDLGLGNIIAVVFVMSFAVLILAFVLPITFTETDTSNWSPGAAALWEMREIISVVGLLITVLGWGFYALRDG